MKYLMPSEAADAIGVSHDTVRRWAIKGWIKAEVLPSGHRRYAPAEIQRVKRQMGANPEHK